MSWTYIAKRAIKRVKSATFGPIFLCTLRACNSENTQKSFCLHQKKKIPSIWCLSVLLALKNIWSKLRKNWKDLLLGSVTFSKAPHYCPHLRPGPTDSNQGMEKGSLLKPFLHFRHACQEHISMRVGKHTNIFVQGAKYEFSSYLVMEMIQYKHVGKTWAEVTLWIVCQDVTRFRWRTSAFVVHSLGKQRDEERDNKPPTAVRVLLGGLLSDTRATNRKKHSHHSASHEDSHLFQR